MNFNKSNFKQQIFQNLNKFLKAFENLKKSSLCVMTKKSGLHCRLYNNNWAVLSSWEATTIDSLWVWYKSLKPVTADKSQRKINKDYSDIKKTAHWISWYILFEKYPTWKLKIGTKFIVYVNYLYSFFYITWYYSLG